VVSFLGIPKNLKHRLRRCTRIMSKHDVASLLNFTSGFLVTIANSVCVTYTNIGSIALLLGLQPFTPLLIRKLSSQCWSSSQKNSENNRLRSHSYRCITHSLCILGMPVSFPNNVLPSFVNMFIVVCCL
jgi:hypothetical protein